MTSDQILGWIVQLLTAGGGGALVAYGAFKFFGKKWIEHELAKDLETAKAEINLLVARRLKLHDREYLVFPEVWSKLNKAVKSLGDAIVSFQEIPDFKRQSDSEIDDWLSHSDLSEDEKRYFTKEHDKVRAYSRIHDWRGMVASRKDFIEFHTYFHSNRIFISPAIKTKLDKIDDLIHSSWIAKKMDWDGYSKGGDTNFLLEAMKKYDKEVKPLMTEIERLVQAKLFPEEG